MKGATAGSVQKNGAGEISIHAPVKGATRNRYDTAYNLLKFQSTLP